MNSSPSVTVMWKMVDVWTVYWLYNSPCLNRILCSRDGTQWIKGGGYIPGLEKDKNSYNGVLGSLVGIINCIEALLPLLQQSNASITTASDNDSAVDC